LLDLKGSTSKGREGERNENQGKEKEGRRVGREESRRGEG